MLAGRGISKMRILGIVALGAALAMLLLPTGAWAGSCDIVLRWDEHAIDACVSELKSEIFVLRFQIQTEQSLNTLMRNNLCLLAMDMKTENAASIAEIACAELRERAEKKKAAGAKSKKP
jgi:hypothetical protein